MHWAWSAFTTGHGRARSAARPLRAGVRDLRARLPGDGRLGLRSVPDRRGAPRAGGEPVTRRRPAGSSRAGRTPSCSSSTRAGSGWTSRGSSRSSSCPRRARYRDVLDELTQRSRLGGRGGDDDDLHRGHAVRARRARCRRAAPARAAARAAPAGRALRPADRRARADQGAPQGRGRATARRRGGSSSTTSRRTRAPRWSRRSSARSRRGSPTATTSPPRSGSGAEAVV